MKIMIPQCRVCPKKDNCEYKANLRSETAKILPAVQVQHNCPVYKNQFKVGDLVSVELLEMHYVTNYDEPEEKWTTAGKFEGVIYYVPKNNRSRYFGVAFAEPVQIHRGTELQSFDTYGVTADKITFIRKYEGVKFWNAIGEVEPEPIFSDKEIIF